jgi:DNA-binding IclR family transcriptional regulator
VVQRTSVGVLDKAVAVIDAVASGPATLNDLVSRTGLSRATAHRLATALVTHQLLARDAEGRFVHGTRLSSGPDLVGLATPILHRLRDDTGESAQLYVRRGDVRLCVAAAEPPAGLRDTVPVGSTLPMTAGSAAQVLLAWSPEPLPAESAFDAGTLAVVRKRGWAATSGEREPGLASVSAPVRLDGQVIAAVSLSGPVERLTRSPGRLHGRRLLSAAQELSDAAG